jgi:hypothetical protein
MHALDPPLPDDWSPGMPSSVFDLPCERRDGGCGRNLRPSDDVLRQLLNGLAAARRSAMVGDS